MDRRAFLKTVAGCGLMSAAEPAISLLAREAAATSYFSLHPFIEAHPEAVFIRRTALSSRDDSEGRQRETLRLANQIFGLNSASGVPLTHKYVIKPNLTSAKGSGANHAIITDPHVTEGLVEGLKRLQIAPANIYVREGLAAEQPGTGYIELAQRSGIHYGDEDARTPLLKECPDGVVFRRTKYLGPFYHPDSYVINLAKFKTHAMGLTLCVKNLQGTCMKPYIGFCQGLQPAIAQDFQPDAEQHVDALFTNHQKEGLPRWDTSRAAWMEMWIQRTIDHYSLIRQSVGLNIIEGLYSQNGDGFNAGPGADGLPEIFLTNMFIFGKDAFRVDIIGHWLGGHEPGNFGLFHVGRERGVSTALNPRNIPVYLWDHEGPRLVQLDSLERTPLKTPYLEKPGEVGFHMCDEPFTYPSEPISACLSGGDIPDFRALGKISQARGVSSLVLEYNLPGVGDASLELYNAAGERVGVPVRGRVERGNHAAVWRLDRVAPGTYYGRLRTGGFEQIKSIRLAG